MSEELPFRIKSVFTLAEGGPKHLDDEIKEHLDNKTEGNNPNSWQNFNEQWSTVCSLERSGGKRSNEVYFSSNALVKLAERHGGSSDSIADNNMKSLSVKTDSKEKRTKIGSSDITDVNSTGDTLYAVFRTTTDSCPSFCCRRNPVLVATLRARAKTADGTVRSSRGESRLEA